MGTSFPSKNWISWNVAALFNGHMDKLTTAGAKPNLFIADLSISAFAAGRTGFN
jgi:hypothetical protein